MYWECLYLDRHGVEHATTVYGSTEAIAALRLTLTSAGMTPLF